MKKLLVPIVIFMFCGKLHAQQLSMIHPIDSSIFIKPFTALKPSLDNRTFFPKGSTSPNIKFNGNQAESFYSKMPVVKMNGNDRMPIVKFNDPSVNYTMLIKKIKVVNTEKPKPLTFIQP